MNDSLAAGSNLCDVVSAALCALNLIVESLDYLNFRCRTFIWIEGLSNGLIVTMVSMRVGTVNLIG